MKPFSEFQKLVANKFLTESRSNVIKNISEISILRRNGFILNLILYTITYILQIFLFQFSKEPAGKRIQFCYGIIALVYFINGSLWFASSLYIMYTAFPFIAIHDLFRNTKQQITYINVLSSTESLPNKIQLINSLEACIKKKDWIEYFTPTFYEYVIYMEQIYRYITFVTSDGSLATLKHFQRLLISLIRLDKSVKLDFEFSNHKWMTAHMRDLNTFQNTLSTIENVNLLILATFFPENSDLETSKYLSPASFQNYSNRVKGINEFEKSSNFNAENFEHKFDTNDTRKSEAQIKLPIQNTNQYPALNVKENLLNIEQMKQRDLYDEDKSPYKLLNYPEDYNPKVTKIRNLKDSTCYPKTNKKYTTISKLLIYTQNLHFRCSHPNNFQNLCILTKKKYFLCGSTDSRLPIILINGLDEPLCTIDFFGKVIFKKRVKHKFQCTPHIGSCGEIVKKRICLGLFTINQLLHYSNVSCSSLENLTESLQATQWVYSHLAFYRDVIEQYVDYDISKMTRQVKCSFIVDYLDELFLSYAVFGQKLVTLGLLGFVIAMASFIFADLHLRKNISISLKRESHQSNNNEGRNKKLQNVSTDLKYLCDAIEKHQLKEVNKILKMGVDVNRFDCNKKSPLMIAVLKNYTDIVEILLRYGANPERANTDGISAIGIAKCIGNEYCIDLLKNKKKPTD